MSIKSLFGRLVRWKKADSISVQSDPVWQEREHRLRKWQEYLGIWPE